MRRLSRTGWALLLALPLGFGCKPASVPLPVPNGGRSGSGEAGESGAATAVTGEGSLPVGVTFRLTQAPSVGATFPLTVTMSSALPQPSLRVRVRGDEGLEVLDGAEFEVDRMESLQSAQREVSLRASAAGLHLVSVEVALGLGAGSQSRAFTYPLIATIP